MRFIEGSHDSRRSLNCLNGEIKTSLSADEIVTRDTYSTPALKLKTYPLCWLNISIPQKPVYSASCSTAAAGAACAMNMKSVDTTRLKPPSNRYVTIGRRPVYRKTSPRGVIYLRWH